MGLVNITSAAGIEIVPVNPNRISLIISVGNATRVFLGTGTAFTTSDALAIIPAGGNLTEDASPRGMYLGSYYARTESASNTVYAWERTRW